MEGSLAKELYSESLQQLSNLELGPTPTANGFDEGDLQDGKGTLWDCFDEELDEATEMDREWQKRYKQLHTSGYHDGLMAGMDAAAQEGFNTGFKESVLVGYNWGLVRGVTSALACLPDGLKERLVGTQKEKNKFQGLYESVHSLSTTDALKLFHDDILTKKEVQQREHEETSSNAAGLGKESLNCSCLENYVGELQSLLVESPALKSHLSVK